MTTKIIENISDREWDQFLDASPQGSVFSSSVFLNALQVEHERLLIEIDGHVIASTLIIKPNDQMFRAPYTYTLYQGIALAPSSKSGYSAALEAQKNLEDVIIALSEKYAYYSLGLHHSLKDLRSFQWFNYHTPENGRFEFNLEYTGIVFLKQFKTFEEYLATIRTSRRQDARKIKRLGFSIEELQSSEEFLRLYKRTFDRQNIEVNEGNLQRVKRIVDGCISDKFGRLVFCRSEDGTLCSATVSLHDDHTSYYMFGATDPDFRSSGANTALLLENIEHSYRSGRTRFDMVGINSPQRGNYKLSFNATPVPYYSVRLKNLLVN